MIKQIRDDIRYLINLLDYRVQYPTSDDADAQVVAKELKEIRERYDLDY